MLVSHLGCCEAFRVYFQLSAGSIPKLFKMAFESLRVDGYGFL
jgi:hypothetical protein